MRDVRASTGTDVAAYARCAAGSTLPAACAAWSRTSLVVDLPSVYLLLDGRLRCQASRGYQVSDGFTPSPASSAGS